MFILDAVPPPPGSWLEELGKWLTNPSNTLSIVVALVTGISWIIAFRVEGRRHERQYRPYINITFFNALDESTQEIRRDVLLMAATNVGATPVYLIGSSITIINPDDPDDRVLPRASARPEETLIYSGATYSSTLEIGEYYQENKERLFYILTVAYRGITEKTYYNTSVHKEKKEYPEASYYILRHTDGIKRYTYDDLKEYADIGVPTHNLTVKPPEGTDSPNEGELGTGNDA